MLSLNNIYEWPLPFRIMISVLLSIVFLYLGYMWDLSSLSEEWTASHTTRAEIYAQIQKVVRDQINLQKKVAPFYNEEILLKKWQKALIPNGQLAIVLNDILKIASDNNIQFRLFDPGSEIIKDVYGQVPIKVIAVGDYHQLSVLVSKIANMNWAVKIGEFTFTAENNKATEKLVQAIAAPLTAEFNFEVDYLVKKEKKQPSL